MSGANCRNGACVASQIRFEIPTFTIHLVHAPAPNSQYTIRRDSFHPNHGGGALIARAAAMTRSILLECSISPCDSNSACTLAGCHCRLVQQCLPAQPSTVILLRSHGTVIPKRLGVATSSLHTWASPLWNPARECKRTVVAVRSSVQRRFVAVGRRSGDNETSLEGYESQENHQ